MTNTKRLKKQLVHAKRKNKRLIKKNKELYASNCAKDTEIAYLYEVIDRYEMCYHFPHSSAHDYRNENEYLGGR